MFSATNFKNYFLVELVTCSGNYSGTVERLRHYSSTSTVLLFGNQHVDRSLFSFCDSVLHDVCIRI